VGQPSSTPATREKANAIGMQIAQAIAQSWDRPNCRCNACTTGDWAEPKSATLYAPTA